MARISITLDDHTAEALRAAAGGHGKASGWAAGVLRAELLRLACGAAAAMDRADDDPEWEAARLAGGLA